MREDSHILSVPFSPDTRVTPHRPAPRRDDCPSLEAAGSELAQLHHASGHDAAATLRALARIVTAALDVERFSVWCATEDREAIRLNFLYRVSSDTVANGTILRKQDFPG